MALASSSNTPGPRAWARIAGVFWLISIMGGLFAEAFVRSKLIADDPATTMQNILANEAIYRLGSVAMFVGTATYLALSAIMYRLLAPVNRTASSIAAFFSIAGCTIWIQELVHSAAPFAFAGAVGPSASAEQMQVLAFALLNLHSEALLLGMMCFGVHCLLMGYLIARSTFLPKLLGFLLLVGGLGYLTAGIAHMLSPPIAALLRRYLFLPGEAAEMLTGLWLAVVGLNAPKWKEQASSAERMV